MEEDIVSTMSSMRVPLWLRRGVAAVECVVGGRFGDDSASVCMVDMRA